MDGKKVIKSIRLENILSYGPDTPEFDLEPLNVIIGPNASGKSNLIEALSIVADTPKDIQEPIRKGGRNCRVALERNPETCQRYHRSNCRSTLGSDSVQISTVLHRIHFGASG